MKTFHQYQVEAFSAYSDGGDPDFTEKRMAAHKAAFSAKDSSGEDKKVTDKKGEGKTAKKVLGAVKGAGAKTKGAEKDTGKKVKSAGQRVVDKIKERPAKKPEATKPEVKRPEVKKPEAKRPAPERPALPAAKKPAASDIKKVTVRDVTDKKPTAQKALPPARNEAYDPEVAGRSQIRKSGEGGRIGAERKKTTPERRRMRAVGGGKTEPVEYKPRKDIGQQRQRSTREQQPTQERGSAASAQAAAAKEERKRAAQARIAARKAGGGDSKPAAKTSSRDTEKAATKLLSTKKPEKKVSPDYKPQKASGMTRGERMSQQRKGEAALKDIMKKQEFSRYERETGQKATGKAKTKLLGRVAKRMAN